MAVFNVRPFNEVAGTPAYSAPSTRENDEAIWGNFSPNLTINKTSSNSIEIPPFTGMIGGLEAVGSGANYTYVINDELLVARDIYFVWRVDEVGQDVTIEAIEVETGVEPTLNDDYETIRDTILFKIDNVATGIVDITGNRIEKYIDVVANGDGLVKNGSIVVPANNTPTFEEVRIPLIEGKQLEIEVVTINNNPISYELGSVSFQIGLGYNGVNNTNNFRIYRRNDIRDPNTGEDVISVNILNGTEIALNTRNNLTMYKGSFNFKDNFIWGNGKWVGSPVTSDEYWTNPSEYNFTKDVSSVNINEIVLKHRLTTEATKIIYKYT